MLLDMQLGYEQLQYTVDSQTSRWICAGSLNEANVLYKSNLNLDLLFNSFYQNVIVYHAFKRCRIVKNLSSEH